MDGRQHYRSFADPLASSLVLTALDIENWMTDLTMMKRFPLSALPQFAHELTHQWCFTSPLGYTLLFLSFRAQKAALMSMEAETADERMRFCRQCERDMVRVQLCQRLMQPIAEGLAEFAEHDAMPGRSEIIGAVFQSLAMLAAGNRVKNKRELPADKLLDNLRAVLLDARATDQHIERKANLLLEPLSALRSPYLCGYLTIKNMWFWALNHAAEHFSDSEFLLYYCKAFFYDDWDWVYLLLKRDMIFPDLNAEMMLDFLKIRLEDFNRNVSEEHAAEFVDRVLNRASSPREFESSNKLLNFSFCYDYVRATTKAAEAQQLLRELVNDVLSPESYKLSDNLFVVWTSLLTSRQNITLGRANYRADPGKLLLVKRKDGKPLVMLPCKEELPPNWNGEVTLVSLFDRGDLRCRLACLAGDKLLGVFSENGQTEDLQDFVRYSPALDPAIRVDYVRLVEAMVREACPGVDEAVAKGWNHVAERFEQMLASTALLFAKDPAKSFAAMKESGFLGVTRDLSMLEQLAALTLPGATIKSMEFPGTKSLSQLRTRRDEILANLQANAGYQPLHFEDDVVYFSFC